MASPSVKRAVGLGISSAATVWNITVAGNELKTDLAVLIVRTGIASNVTVTGGCPSWTQLLLDNTDATDDNTYVFYGRYDVLAAGDIRINLSASAKGAYVLYTLSGAADPATRTPEISTRQIFTTVANTGNAPAITPTGGSKDYLFITAIGLGGSITPGGAPAGYNQQYFFGGTSTGGQAATNCSVYGITRAATVASEDAGAWTHAAANLGGVTFTIAIHPAGPPPVLGALAFPITFGKDVKGFVPGNPAVQTSIDDFNRPDGPLKSGIGTDIWSGHRLFDPNYTDLFLKNNALEVLTGDGYATQTGSIIDLKSTNDFIFDYVTDSGTDNNPIEVYMAMSNEGANWNGTRFYYDAGSDRWTASDYVNGAATGLGSFVANGRPKAGESYWFRTVGRIVSLFKKESPSDPWSKIGTWNCSVRPTNSGHFGFLFRGVGQRIDNIRGGPVQVVQYGQVALPIIFDSVTKGKSNNLVENGYFEQDVSGWYVSEGGPSFSRSTVDSHEGSASMKVVTLNQYDSVATDIPTEAGRVYIIGFWVKRNEFTQNDWRLETANGLTPQVVNIPQVGGWQYITMTVRAQWTGVGNIRIRNVTWPAINDGTGFVYVDEVKAIQYVPKTYSSSVAFPITFDKQVRGRLGKNYHDEVLADSPLIYWRMDEAGAPIDYSGNGYHITTDSGSVQVPGLIPWEPLSMAKGFNGTMMNRGNPSFYQNTMSFEVWLQRARTNVYEIFIDQYNSGWTIAVNSDGRIYVRRSYGPDLAVSSRIKILDTLPHHFVVTADFKTREVIFYLDDQVPESVIGNPWDHSGPANYPVFVGSQWGAYPFQGTMDEMAIYPYVLSPNQIAYHRTQGLRLAPKTYFGATDFPISFNKEVNGSRKSFAKTNSPFVFGKAVAATRTTFSKIDNPITFGEVTSGIRVPFRYYGQVALPIAFSKDVKGQRKAFGRTALPITFAKDVNGRRTTFGKLDLQIVGGQYVRGILHSYSQSSMQTLFGKETAGRRKTFGQVAVPLIFSKDVRGKRKTFGRVALPIVFDGNTIAQRQTFGEVAAPFIFDSAVQGTRTALGKLYLPMNLLLAVGEGHLGVHGEVSLPVVMTMDTSGKVIHVGVILNNAKMIYLGTVPVQAVYVDDQKVWPMT